MIHSLQVYVPALLPVHAAPVGAPDGLGDAVLLPEVQDGHAARAQAEVVHDDVPAHGQVLVHVLQHHPLARSATGRRRSRGAA